MPSNRPKVRMIACLAFALLANFEMVPTSHAGPISDMLARHRMNKAMKLPPMDKPFSKEPFRDPNLKTASLKDRFKKRFSIGRGKTDGAVPVQMNRDFGVINTTK